MRVQFDMAADDVDAELEVLRARDLNPRIIESRGPADVPIVEISGDEYAVRTYLLDGGFDHSHEYVVVEE